VHIEDRTREGGGTSPRWTTTARPSSAGYTAELEPGHSGRAKPAKATELQAPCVINTILFSLVSALYLLNCIEDCIKMLIYIIRLIMKSNAV
jgi:hypothetical protein